MHTSDCELLWGVGLGWKNYYNLVLVIRKNVRFVVLKQFSVLLLEQKAKIHSYVKSEKNIR